MVEWRRVVCLLLFSSDRSDPVIWHRSQSSESFEELPRRVSYSVQL